MAAFCKNQETFLSLQSLLENALNSWPVPVRSQRPGTQKAVLVFLLFVCWWRDFRLTESLHDGFQPPFCPVEDEPLGSVSACETGRAAGYKGQRSGS